MLYLYLIITTPYDWRSTKNDNLWQGVSGTNSHALLDIEVSTEAEFTAEITDYAKINAVSAYTSSHKFVVAGLRSSTSRALYNTFS
jgi:hypothetical protein